MGKFTTPDTLAYMILAYGVAAIVMSGLVVALLIRQRNLRAELKELESLANEQGISELESAQTANPAMVPKPTPSVPPAPSVAPQAGIGENSRI